MAFDTHNAVIRRIIATVQLSSGGATKPAKRQNKSRHLVHGSRHTPILRNETTANGLKKCKRLRYFGVDNKLTCSRWCFTSHAPQIFNMIAPHVQWSPLFLTCLNYSAVRAETTPPWAPLLDPLCCNVIRRQCVFKCRRGPGRRYLGFYFDQVTRYTSREDI